MLSPCRKSYFCYGSVSQVAIIAEKKESHYVLVPMFRCYRENEIGGSSAHSIQVSPANFQVQGVDI